MSEVPLWLKGTVLAARGNGSNAQPMAPTGQWLQRRPSPRCESKLMFYIVYRQSPLGHVDPSFRALPGRLKFTVRRHQFNKDYLFFERPFCGSFLRTGEVFAYGGRNQNLTVRNDSLRGQQMPSPRPWKMIRYFHSPVRNPS